MAKLAAHSLQRAVGAGGRNGAGLKEPVGMFCRENAVAAHPTAILFIRDLCCQRSVTTGTAPGAVRFIQAKTGTIIRFGWVRCKTFAIRTVPDWLTFASLNVRSQIHCHKVQILRGLRMVIR